MSGFTTVGEFANADLLGQCWLTQFRKIESAATALGNWVDYSYFAGSPTSNFYASAPYVAALVERDKGFTVPNVAPMTQHMKSLNVMTSSLSGGATNARQRLVLCDYLLYYPFIDTDAVGETQTMINTVDDFSVPSLPRYTSGRVIAVAQSPATAAATFTITYTNQDGVSGRVSQTNFASLVTAAGTCVTAIGTNLSYTPYLTLAGGDNGVRSIESVTFTVGGGGLMALVIVKPLFNGYVTQECRTSAGVAFGAADEFVSVINHAGAPQIKDGAVLNLIAQANTGNAAGSPLIGVLETVWN